MKKIASVFIFCLFISFSVVLFSGGQKDSQIFDYLSLQIEYDYGAGILKYEVRNISEEFLFFNPVELNLVDVMPHIFSVVCISDGVRASYKKEMAVSIGPGTRKSYFRLAPKESIFVKFPLLEYYEMGGCTDYKITTSMTAQRESDYRILGVGLSFSLGKARSRESVNYMVEEYFNVKGIPRD